MSRIETSARLVTALFANRVHYSIGLAAIVACSGCADREPLRGSSTAQTNSTACGAVIIPLVHVLRVPFYPLLLMAGHDLDELTPLEHARE